MGKGGGKSAARGGGGSTRSQDSTKQQNNILNANTKFSTKEIKSMSREQLETVSRVIYIKQSMSRGNSFERANEWAKSLMPSNSTTYLRQYI